MAKKPVKPKAKKPRKEKESEQYQKPHDNRIYQQEWLDYGCYRRTVDFDRLDRQ